MSAAYFDSPAAFGAWLDAHHASETELLVGFWKANTGRPTMTWPDSVDEALCYGWIDAVRKSVDDERYTIRFTRRKRGSKWSHVNVAKAQALIAAGRMRPVGLTAFEAREGENTGVYSFEQPRENVVLSPEEEAAFRAQPAAWAYFEARAGSYRRAAIWWVISAKRAETRASRLVSLVTHSAEERTLAQFTAWKKR